MIVLKGRIEGDQPLVFGDFDPGGRLEIGVDKGPFAFLVDTGFSGDLAVPTDVLAQLGAREAFVGEFLLPTGEVVELPVYTAEVVVGGRTFELELVASDELLVGMGFMRAVADKIVLNFASDEILFEREG